MRTLLAGFALAALVAGSASAAEVIERHDNTVAPSTGVVVDRTGPTETKSVTRTDDGTGCGSKTVHKEDDLGNSKTVHKEGC